MGLIDGVFSLLFGGGRNVIRETAEVFTENSEAGAQRSSEWQKAVLSQFATEFVRPRQSKFDSVVDGLNRLPRPAMAFGTIGLFAAAMVDPVWFSARMQGITLVPEPLWWLLGAIISFYFGARHQAKGQEFQRSIAETLGRTKEVHQNINDLYTIEQTSDLDTGPNAALEDWRRQQ